LRPYNESSFPVLLLCSWAGFVAQVSFGSLVDDDSRNHVLALGGAGFCGRVVLDCSAVCIPVEPAFEQAASIDRTKNQSDPD
jgi:hypothetical protein